MSDYALSLRCDSRRPQGSRLADIAFQSMNIYSTGQTPFFLSLKLKQLTHPTAMITWRILRQSRFSFRSGGPSVSVRAYATAPSKNTENPLAGQPCNIHRKRCDWHVSVSLTLKLWH